MAKNSLSTKGSSTEESKKSSNTTESSVPPTTKSSPKKGSSKYAKRATEEFLSSLGVDLATWSDVRRRCQVAKDRCVNPKNRGYANYGGRGLKFAFATGSDMAEWVFRHLGPKPSSDASLDRIDNALGYLPGNLRWASRKIQNSNKRPYIRWVYGERMQKLLDARPDFSYETIRGFVKQGLSDDAILTRPKTTSGRPRVRYRKLRSS